MKRIKLLPLAVGAALCGTVAVGGAARAAGAGLLGGTPALAVSATLAESAAGLLSALGLELPDDDTPRGEGALTYTEESARLESGQEAPLVEYMSRSFEALARLEVPELEGLFSDGLQERAAESETAVQVGLRQLIDGVDYSLKNYRWTLEVDSVVQNRDGTVAVTAMETAAERFAQFPGMESDVGKVCQYFRLEERDGVWYIREHMRYDKLWARYLASSYCRTTWEAAAQKYVDAVPGFLEEMRGIWGDLSSHAANPVWPGEPDHPYDREAAVAYADRYALERNPDWVDYSNQGGNCQNFISQCILAGGIPMDPEGDAVWKWYSGGVANRPGQSGRSSSWAGVVYFDAYARENTGFGMVCVPDAPYDVIQPGDALLMGTEDRLRHTVFIRGVVTDGEGKTVDYLVNSNTNDLRCYPASLYGYPFFELIHILGWNDA